MAMAKEIKQQNKKYFAKKYLYYMSWYLSIPIATRESDILAVRMIPDWVLERVLLFRDLISEIDTAELKSLRTDNPALN